MVSQYSAAHKLFAVFALVVLVCALMPAADAQWGWGRRYGGYGMYRPWGYGGYGYGGYGMYRPWGMGYGMYPYGMYGKK